MKIINGAKIYSLELSETHLAVLHSRLIKGIFEEVAPTIQEINDQLTRQMGLSSVPDSKEEKSA